MWYASIKYDEYMLEIDFFLLFVPLIIEHKYRLTKSSANIYLYLKLQ